MSSYSFRLPFPLSVNTCWRKGPKGTYLTKRGREFRKQAIADLSEQLGDFDTITGRVAVSLQLTAPTRRKYDVDNYAKAPLDALEHAGLLANDEQIDQLIITRLHVEPPGCCDVTVTELEA